MGLETVPYVPGLNTANPPNTDQRKQGDDHLRLIKTAVKQSMELMGGGFTTGGTSTAYTVTTGHVNTPTYQDGHLYAVALHAANGASATINYDGIGARTLKKLNVSGSWVDLAASDFPINTVLLMYYEAGDTTFRVIASSADPLKYLSLAGGTLTGAPHINFSDDTPAGLPLNWKVTSASPAASDLLVYLNFIGKDSGGNDHTYAQIVPIITDPTNTSEDGEIYLAISVAGTVTERLRIASNGVQFGTANFRLHFDGTNGVITFDSTDDYYFDRAANTFVWRVGGASIGSLSTTLGLTAVNTPVAAVSYQFPAGVPTVDRHINVSSLTDNATGDVTVNLTSAAASAELTSGMSGAVLAGNVHTTFRNLNRGQTTTALQLISLDFLGAAVDATRCAAIWVNGV